MRKYRSKYNVEKIAYIKSDIPILLCLMKDICTDIIEESIFKFGTIF